MRIIIILLALCFSQLSQADVKVSASIKPLHSLASSLLEGVAEVTLIQQNNQSPHHMQLKPSQLKAIKSSDLIVWAGPSIESYLAPFAKQGDTRLFGFEQVHKQLPLLYTQRVEHHHDHAHDEHPLDEYDQHFWLHPANGLAFAKALAAQLMQLYPQHATQVEQNLASLTKELRTLEAMMASALEPHQQRAFMVMHDGSQYFDRPFALNWQGAIVQSEELSLSAKDLIRLHQTIRSKQVVCLLSEPQFDPAKVNQLAKQNQIRTAQIDALGAELEPGAALYFQLMAGLVESFLSCMEDDPS